MIESSAIEAMIPTDEVSPEDSYFANGMMVLRDPIDAYDSSKIKIATDMFGYGLYRPVPDSFSKRT